MANGNGNGKWVLWTAGIIATLLFSIIGFMGRGVVANDVCSRDRDDRLNSRATANEVRINRLEECQISTKEKLAEINIKLEKQDNKLDRILNKVQ